LLERAINHRALLRKMTYKDKASYGSSPPCTSECIGSRSSHMPQCSIGSESHCEYTRTLNGVMKGESRIHTHSFVTDAAIFYWERVTLRIHTHSSWSHEERGYRLHSLICVTYATHDTSSLTQNTRYSHSPWRVSDIHSHRESVTQDTPCVYMHTHSQ